MLVPEPAYFRSNSMRERSMSNSSLASQSSLDEKIDENLLQHLDSKWVESRPPETPTRFAMFEIVHRVLY